MRIRRFCSSWVRRAGVPTRPPRTPVARILREAAASALAQAGYESDPRLRGAARRIVDRLSAYLRSPLAQKPWVRAGNQQVLAPEATPPSFYTLVMLAFMPLFRSEHYDVMDRLFQFLAQPMPRQMPARLLGDKVVPQPHLVLGDPLPHRNAADADVPWALTWMEVAARLGYMRRHEGWAKLYDRFLDDRDEQGVWHPHKGMAMPRSSNALVWPSFPLESHHAGDERWSDVTFRLGLIGRLRAARSTCVNERAPTDTFCAVSRVRLVRQPTSAIGTKCIGLVNSRC